MPPWRRTRSLSSFIGALGGTFWFDKARRVEVCGSLIDWRTICDVTFRLDGLLGPQPQIHAGLCPGVPTIRLCNSLLPNCPGAITCASSKRSKIPPNDHGTYGRPLNTGGAETYSFTKSIVPCSQARVKHSPIFCVRCPPNNRSSPSKLSRTLIASIFWVSTATYSSGFRAQFSQSFVIAHPGAR